jgi:hypothetical protein
MHFRADIERHQELVEELLTIFIRQGFHILAAVGIPGLPSPQPLTNDGYGDQEKKAPDIYAFDDKRKSYIIGEAKTGNADLDTIHAMTEYNVYLDQFDPQQGHHAIVYVILPADKIPEFNSFVTHYVHSDYLPRIVVVASRQQEI